jgi:hypothetical protein
MSINFLTMIVVSFITLSALSIFLLSLRISYLSGFQKGVAKGRDITIKAYEESFGRS